MNEHQTPNQIGHMGCSQQRRKRAHEMQESSWIDDDHDERLSYFDTNIESEL